MPGKILVVEDNEKNLTLIKDVLEYHGFEVRTAADGASGLSLAREYLPDVMLMDIQMPVMDGLTAVKRIKDDPHMRKIHLIALTSFAMKGDREKMLAAGFDDYIAKPIDTRKLPEIVRRYVPALT